ncbi:hypothetical protein ARMGADRAFT_1039780 [Armillaria gallica]|uniref:Uncharacterized protein n=1 Tax=Armillaria gallica TaxID=47427 RepID=A0A2H3CCS1_ARMGA|nr:hypothetical protein ARMGADRAFT_1039780 [Armillaria gallica]
MPYQPPSPDAADTATVEVKVKVVNAIPNMVNIFVEDPLILSPDIRDSINSSGPHFLEVFNNQPHVPTLAMPGLDCAIALIYAAGKGLIVGAKLFMFAMNCGRTPLLPTPLATGELPVIVYAVGGIISRPNLYFTLVYLLNHDTADLFRAVLGHMFFPYFKPFPARERKTADPPINLVNDVLEVVANILRQMPLADLEKLEIHVKGFLHIQKSLDITDMGFRDVIRACCMIVNKALRRPEDMVLMDRVAYSYSQIGWSPIIESEKRDEELQPIRSTPLRKDNSGSEEQVTLGIAASGKG